MPADYVRVEKAIRYLEENFLEQPSLQELAAHVDLSPFHFQRLFKRWAGISPKRFLQFLTVQHAKTLLDESRSILETTYESGLSSPGRLHDLFVTIHAVTPGQFKTRGVGVEICYGFHPSPFGECLLAITERGICGLNFITEGGRAEAVASLQNQWQEAELREDPQKTKPLLDQVFSPEPYEDGQTVTLFLRGTNFQLKIWEALLRIPPGFVCSYEDIARYIGKPTAARAVGNAVGANPVAYVIPCHRVIKKTGIFGNYGSGPARKKAMIGWEAALSYRYLQGQEGIFNE